MSFGETVKRDIVFDYKTRQKKCPVCGKNIALSYMNGSKRTYIYKHTVNIKGMTKSTYCER